MAGNITKEQALILLAKTTMREFSKEDWYVYAGCMSAIPMVGEYEDYVVVVDGNKMNVIHSKNVLTGGQLFHLEEK